MIIFGYFTKQSSQNLEEFFMSYRISFLAVFLCACGLDESSLKRDQILRELKSNAVSENHQYSDDALPEFQKPKVVIDSQLILDAKEKIKNEMENLEDSLTVNIDKNNQELLWDFSQSELFLSQQNSIMKEISLHQGALPKSLIPSVRENILSDPKIKAMMNLPGFVVDLVKNLFVNDEKISTEINSGVSQKIKTALNTQNDLSEQLKFQFDGFPKNYMTQDSINSFSIAEQSLRWNFILNEIYLNTSGSLQDELGLQISTMNLSLLLAEWEYLFGLKKSSASKKSYGGLVQRMDQDIGVIGPFDPREVKDVPGILYSEYLIKKPEGTLLEKAIKGGETWKPTSYILKLDEQVLLWSAAAKFFHNLRPKNRTENIKKLFNPTTGMFPDDAYKLALVFLPSMKFLLKGGFINKETKEIKSELNLDSLKINSEVGVGSPDLLTLARLTRTLVDWVSETQDLSDSDLSPEQMSKLQRGANEMLDGARLTIQKILTEFVEYDSLGENLDLIVEDQENSIKIKAEVLSHLAFAEETVIQSPFLHEKILKLFDRFIREDLNNHGQLKVDELIWVKKALSELDTFVD